MSHQVSEHIIRESGKPGHVKRLNHRMYINRSDINKLQVLALSLTQTCKQVRSEFRPIHFRHHVVTLYDLSTYLFGLREWVKSSITGFGKWRKTLDICRKFMTTLELVVEPRQNLDLTKVLRLHMDDSPCKVVARRATPRHEDLIAPFAHIFNNRNETWRKWILTGDIQSVKMNICTQYDGFPASFIELYVDITTFAAEKWEGIGKRWRRERVGSIIGVDSSHKQNIGMHVPRIKIYFVASLG